MNSSAGWWATLCLLAVVISAPAATVGELTYNRIKLELNLDFDIDQLTCCRMARKVSEASFLCKK